MWPSSTSSIPAASKSSVRCPDRAPGELRLVFAPGVDLRRSLPEHGEWALSARGVIPDAGSDDALLASDARHLAQARDGIRHEVHDELCERCVERAVGEREVLGRRALHVDLRMALARRGDERLRRIDCRDRRRTEPPYELRGQRAGAAADVEHALSARPLRRSRRTPEQAEPSSGP